MVSNNATITGLPQPFIDFGNLIVFGVFPSIFLIAVGVILIGWFVLRYTVFGRFIYAIGTNEEAVRLSGHNPRTLQDRRLHHQRTDRRRRRHGLSVAPQRRQPDRRRGL